MFEIGGSEILVILVLTLLVMGPQNIPKVARTLGKVVQQVRRITNEFKHALDDEIRSLEIEELKNSIPKVDLKVDLKASPRNKAEDDKPKATAAISTTTAPTTTPEPSLESGADNPASPEGGEA